MYNLIRLIIAVISLISGGAAIVGCSDKPVKNISQEIPYPDKTSAPVSISYSVPERVSTGGKVDVTIEIKTNSDVDNLKVHITQGEGLELIGGEREIEYGTQYEGSQFSETVTVVPQAEGILYLNVFVSGLFNGINMNRAAAVPVSAGYGDGSQALKKAGEVTTGPQGEKIIITPAETNERMYK